MTAPVQVSVMGAVRVLRDGAEVRISSPRERAVLARLAIDTGRVVSVERLGEAVWNGTPPASARTQVAICVSRIRRALGGRSGLITTAPPGYLLSADGTDTDWPRFVELVARARESATADLRRSVGLAKEALALRRGEPFADLPGLRAEAARLDAAWLDTVEMCAEWQLELGWHELVSEELPVIAAEHPLRERLRAQLMIALQRTNRRADALRSYQDARRALIEQVGLEPGAELRDLHAMILRDEALPAREPRAPVRTTVVPGQLPRQPSPFVGRARETTELDLALRHHADAAGAVVLTGPAGVGKTALGLWWAYRRVDCFPDGQLHADLVDDDGAPVRPGAVLTRFLHALGVPASAVPDSDAEKVALYRTSVAGRRVLVFLDSAVNSAQVRALLPGGPGARVIVTSRDPMSELVAREGASHLPVGPLGPAEAALLLSKLLGDDWVTTRHREVTSMVTGAGGLPLPLRRAAARHITARTAPLGNVSRTGLLAATSP